MKKEYNEKGLFDNELIEQSGELSAFSLEVMVRSAAQRMIQAALGAEVTEFLQRLPGEKAAADFRGYRNGYHRERTVSTAVGGLRVKVPRVSDSAEKFQSRMILPYKRRSEGLDLLFPKLFVEGLATRDFEPALRFLVRAKAPLSPSTISRLNKEFKNEYEAWLARDLRQLKIVYMWADGIYLKAGIADERRCLLVIIGVDMEGRAASANALGRVSGIGRELVSGITGFATARIKRAGIGDGRRRLRLLGGVAESVASKEGTTLLAAQNAEYLEQITKTRTRRSRLEIAGNLFGKRERNGGKIGQELAQ